ncbi:MAG TPA: hypothetical protein VK721_08855 [Solirubrobacteraceae bacterium]|jgi:hypothetical protein|nr:hypothetical protein [Solirubrobacteraceae bacterium]
MFARTALTGLLAAAVIAICPALAQAVLTPTLTLEQGAGTTAGTSPATGFNINFNPRLGVDSVKNLTIAFPPGFLLNLGMNSGECVTASAPNPLCVLGTGTINSTKGLATPVTLYLVAPPTLANVAGIAFVLQGGATITGPVSPSPTSPAAWTVSFLGFPIGIEEMQFTLAGPRLPTTCSASRTVTIQTLSYELGSTASASAPLAVTGCNTLPYAPKVAATVTKIKGGAQVVVTITQSGADEAATGAIAFGNPNGVKINKVLAPCFKGSTCTVGTVDASSPDLPVTALNAGLLTLAGSINSGSLSQQVTGAVTMSFPPPYQFSVVGPLNLTEHTITFLSFPDIPLNSISYTFTGVPAGPAFTTECQNATITATLVPQNGNPAVKVTGPVTNVGCSAASAKPKASGSWSGLTTGKPKLSIHAHGGSGAGLVSLSFGLPSGLSFSHRSLTAAALVKGLSLSGAHVKSVRIANGRLAVIFTQGASAVSLVARGPLLHETSTLEGKAKQHKTGTLAASVRVTDATGHTTSLRVG